MKRDRFLLFIVLSLLFHALLLFSLGIPETDPAAETDLRRVYHIRGALSQKKEPQRRRSLPDKNPDASNVPGKEGEESLLQYGEEGPGEKAGDENPPKSFIPAEVTGIDITYPYLSRREGEEGDVWAEVLVGSDGRLIEVKIVKSSGYERLDRAVIEGIRKSRTRPAVENGSPVRSRRILGPFRFRLKE
jgi:TonB family protein